MAQTKKEELIKAWKKHGISQHKIDKMETKQAKHEADLAIIEAT